MQRGTSAVLSQPQPIAGLTITISIAITDTAADHVTLAGSEPITITERISFPLAQPTTFTKPVAVSVSVSVSVERRRPGL